VAADVAGDLAATGGVADEDDVAEVERVEERREIVRVRVHVVAGPRLARAAVAAAVVGDDAMAALGHEHHLQIPRVGRQRPAM